MGFALRSGGLVLLFALGLAVSAAAQPRAPLTYPIPDTGQVRCFGQRGPIAYPHRGKPWFGQGAQWVRPGPTAASP